MIDKPDIPAIRKPSSHHFESLDGLRGIAVMMVLLFHSQPDLGMWVYRGYTGVALFFVLSGFLITGILIDSREALNYFSSFYARRALRIFPVFYGTLIVLLLIVPRVFPGAHVPPPHDRIFYFVYLNNWTRFLYEPNNIPYVGHLWSLAVEEQFYWLWPLVVYRASDKWLRYISMLAIPLGVATALYLHWMGASPGSIGRNTVVALPTLMAGSLCAIYFRRPVAKARLQSHSRLLLSIAACLTIVFALCSMSRYQNTWGPGVGGLALDFAFALYVLAAVLGPSLYMRFLALAPLRRLGRYSYGMYVYHIPFFTFFNHFHWLQQGPFRAVVRICLVFILAALSYELVEKRINAYKTRFRTRFAPSEGS